LAERLGRRAVLLCGVAVMSAAAALLLVPALSAVIAGLLVFTFGFFAAHATASAWVGQRATAARAQAAALYTLAYYLGSSTFGWLGGVCYDSVGWSGVVAYVLGLCAASVLAGAALRERRR
ncbi:MFS transporter, partial [Streptomonospora algeriensis]